MKCATALAEAGLVTAEQARALEPVAARYAVAITPAIAALIDPSDPNDPIAQQFVPSTAELDQTPEETPDPIGDDRFSPVPGLVHRYPDRVLLKIVSACPVYCRFCFRREHVGQGEPGLIGAALETALDYIRERPAIWEVILTGGDPFVLSPRRIATVTPALAGIDHVKVIRWHTRMPVADPARVDAEMVSALRTPDAAVWVAAHVNHARELTPEARAAIGRMVDAGLPVVSQTVLLKGVNDDPDTLEALMRALVEARVKPYYLHHGDLAPGTGHFRTSIDTGQALLRRLHGRASGLCQPTYVLDIPGGQCKAPIGPCYARKVDDEWVVEGD
ncbi:MAG: lysine-2,3-aminomutase-like protein [Maricaulaceae bacterium]